MPRFQGLHVVPKVEPPESPSTGLEPYLALPPKRKAGRRSKRRAIGLEIWLDVILLVTGAGIVACVLRIAELVP